MDLTPKEKNRLLSAADIVDRGDMAVLEKLLEFADTLENNTQKIEDTVTRADETVATLKEEVSSALEEVKGIVKGKDGVDYVLTDEDKKNIANSITVPVVEKVIEKTTIKEPVIIKEITNEIKEVAKPTTAEEERDKLESLKGDARLDITAIKGVGNRLNKLTEYIINRAIEILDQRTQFLINKVSNLSDRVNNSTGASALTIKDEGSTLTTTANSIDFVGAGVTATNVGSAVTVTISTSAGAGYQVPLSGVVDGSNKVFVWATAPNAISIDNTNVFNKKNITPDLTDNWTGTTTTTLSVAPNNNIYAIA